MRTFQPGDTFYLRKGMPDDQPYKCHVVAVVEGQVVYKWYGKSKQWLHYGVEDQELLDHTLDFMKR